MIRRFLARRKMRWAVRQRLLLTALDADEQWTRLYAAQFTKRWAGKMERPIAFKA